MWYWPLAIKNLCERILLAHYYKRLFAASFAFCRAPASAPAVRICSKLSELEGGIASMEALICGGASGVTFAAFVAVTSGARWGVTFASVAAICGGTCTVFFVVLVAAICGGACGVAFAMFVAVAGAGACGAVFAATTPPLIS